MLPFHYVGTDTTFQPLERGLAAVIVTDLSRVQRLKLIARARVQVRAADARIAAAGSNADELRALFDIEKAVVFQLLD